MKRVFLNSVVAASLASVLTLSSSTSGQAISMVVPAELENVEGAGGSGGNQSTPGPNGQRVQVITPNSEFDDLPETHQWLTGIRFRPDRLVTFPASYTTDTVVIRYSTTSQSPSDISLAFEDNIGTDETIVFDGSLTLSTENTGPADGPRDFDVIVDFDTPFFYDRSEGKNLVLDWTSGPSTATFGVDGSGNGQSPIWGIVSNVSDVEEIADFSFSGGSILEYLFAPKIVPGDFNQNGVLDAGDVDLLSAVARAGDNDVTYDLNQDGQVDDADRTVWVQDLNNTYFGDANLDGQFSTVDLVAVLASGEYEDDIVGNSGWATGDWDGDADATSADLVVALADGGFEQGPRGAVRAVPEPASLMLFIIALGYILVYRDGRDVHRMASSV